MTLYLRVIEQPVTLSRSPRTILQVDFPHSNSSFPFIGPIMDQFAVVDLPEDKLGVVFRQANNHLQVSPAFANAGAKPRAPIPALAPATTTALRSWKRTAESIDTYWSRYTCIEIGLTPPLMLC